MKLWRHTVRQVRTRPARAFLTLLSIVLGVGAVVSVSMATRVTRRAYQGMFQAMAGKADLEISGLAGGAFPQAEVLPWLGTVPGVQAVTPVIQRRTVIYLADHERVGTSILAIDPETSAPFRDFQITSGSLFQKGAGIVLEASFARNLGLKLHDTVRIKMKGQKLQEATIVGLFEPKGATSLVQGGMVILPLPAAQQGFYSVAERKKKPVTAVQIILAKGADLNRVKTLIAGKLREMHEQALAVEAADQVEDEAAADSLPRHVELAIRAPTARTQQAEATQQQTEMALQMATALSLVVAMFIILNTFLMNVSERRRQFGIMRAIGATRSQIVGMLLGEGLMMGVVGTFLGTVAGLVGAYFLTRAMTQLARTELPPLQLTPTPFLLGAAFGLGISLAGTYLPARRAGKLSPLEGMSTVAPEDRDGFPPFYTWVGAITVCVTLALLAACIMGWLPMGPSVIFSVVMLIGLVLLLPSAIDGLASIATAFLMPFIGLEGRLANRQILRRRTRTSLTIGVLFVAISTGIGLAGTLVDNVREIKDWYHRTVVGDFFVRAMIPDNSPGAMPDMPPELGDEIASIPGVQQVETMRWVKTDARHPARTVGAPEPAPVQVTVICREFKSQDHVSLALVDGSTEEVRAAMDRGEVVIGTVLAQKLGLERGEQVQIDTPRGRQSFTIAGMTNEYNYGGLAVYMQRDRAAKFFDVTGVDAFIIMAESGSAQEVESALRSMCDEYGLMLNSFEELARLVEGLMAGVIGCLWGLLFLGFVVAAFGIVNTLMMNVLEQTRELGLMRIVAMTKGQVRKMILAQAAIMGFLGLAPGMLAGIAVAWLAAKASLNASGHAVQFEFHPGMLSLSFAAAFVIVVIAAWAPAERAARLELVQALQYE